MPFDPNYRCLLDAELRPMTDKESRIFIAIAMSSLEAREEMAEQSQAFQMLSKRLEYHEVEVDLGLIILISALCKSPGELVMWAYTLFLMQEGKSCVTLDDFMMGPFAMGVPTESAYEQAWDAQKIAGDERDDAGPAMLSADNWLDRLETWER